MSEKELSQEDVDSLMGESGETPDGTAQADQPTPADEAAPADQAPPSDEASAAGEAAAEDAPAAGPDSIIRTGNLFAVSEVEMPPFDIMINSRPG